MSRLYSRTGACAVDDPEYGHFEANEEGGFDFPEELSGRLHKVHHRREPQWESEDERSERLNGAEVARRRDPETLFSVVASIAEAMSKLSASHAGVPQVGPDPAVAALAAQVEALTAQLAALQQPAAATGPEAPAAEDGDSAEEAPAGADGAQPAKGARPRSKTTPAKG